MENWKDESPEDLDAPADDNWQAETPPSLRLAARILSDLAGVVLVGMMLITVYDIFARSLGFGSFEPVVELTTMGVVIVASFGIAITTIRGGHVIIDLFTRNNKVSTNNYIDAFWLLFMGLMLALMAVLSLQEGLQLHEYGTVTEILNWSVLAYYAPPVLGWSVAALVAFWIVLRVFFRRS
jgi:TRAP-type C4-dicarboxylate transport system permease small subunit